MSVDERLSFEDESEDDLDLLDDEQPGSSPTSVGKNYGQMAGVVYGDMIMHVSQEISRFRAYHNLSTDYVSRTMDGFVERVYQTADRQAVDHRGAAELLKEHRCLVLIGNKDSGRHTAAVAVLNQLRIPLREVTGWDTAHPDALHLADLPIDPHSGSLLELPETLDGIAAGFPRRLASYRERLRSISSYLVVVASPTTWKALNGYHDASVLMVEPPNSLVLLTREVQIQAPHEQLGRLVEHPRIAALANGAIPREVARLADLLVKAIERTSGERSVDALVDDVASAYQNWDTELINWFERNEGVRERLFLIATAMLEGGHADVVLRFADRLGEILGEAVPGHNGIREAGIRQLAKCVGAKVDAEGRIEFLRPGYAPAVLDFVRADRSDLFHQRLWQWAAQLPFGLAAGTSATRLADRVATVMLGATRRHKDPRILRYAASHWAKRRDLQPVAVGLLTAAALSPEAGAATRGRLNRWVMSSSNPDLLCTVADVCQGPLADSYPEVVLTRLNHLAQKQASKVQDKVVEAVVALWARPRLRPRLLDVLARWLSATEHPDVDKRTAEVGCRILARLSRAPDPTSSPLAVALENHPNAWTALVNAVRGIVDQQPSHGDAVATFFAWLDFAAADETIADALSELFVAALSGPAPTARIVVLRTICYGWQPVDGEHIKSERRILRERIVEQLHRADPMVTRWVIPSDDGEGKQDAPNISTTN